MVQQGTSVNFVMSLY
ncbi:Protein of unknown function [Bacillus wiedmannii]|nr:Protein of unknown function [Bacillus wiedmannii]